MCLFTLIAAPFDWPDYSNRVLIGRLPIGIIGHWKQSAIGFFMLSGQSVNVANRPIGHPFQSANRDICSMWPIGQCHQFVGNTKMYEKMSNFYEGWRQIGKSYQLRLIGTSYRHSWLEKPTHWTHWINQSGQSAISFEYWKIGVNQAVN